MTPGAASTASGQSDVAVVGEPHRAVLVWFRHDLRLDDNPALQAAVATGSPIVPCHLWTPEEEGQWHPGAASRVYLHQSLLALAAELERRGSRLVLRRGRRALELLNELIAETGATAVYWNRRYEPTITARDAMLKQALRDRGIEARSFNAALLLEPHEAVRDNGEPYKVFTPFYNAHYRTLRVAEPWRAPRRLKAPATFPAGEPPAALGLEPGIDWAGGIRNAWESGEAGAHRALEAFLHEIAADYAEGRDRPAMRGTSRLSPHLHFGEISPRQIWHAAGQHADFASGRPGFEGLSKFRRELVWREFAHALLHHFPETPEACLRPEFRRFPWKKNRRLLEAWQRGRTGYPIVDAGMRELWAIGWMHNRVRMIVASFLVKDLMQPWQAGAEWFWDTLVDADLANNTLGWQWTAGCGADAAPFFRIFNPVLQGRKFDPDGAYVRRWVPELGRMESRHIHDPWNAPQAALARAGVILGKTYPRPIVDHGQARETALDHYHQIRG